MLSGNEIIYEPVQIGLFSCIEWGGVGLREGRGLDVMRGYVSF